MAQQKHYKIPSNFRDTGYLFNGMIAVRNFIDALALAIGGWTISGWLPIPQNAALSVRLTFAGLFGIVGLFGVAGVPLSTFLVDWLRWLKRRKPYLYNTHGGIFSVSAADVMLNTPGFRDVLADTLDKVRASMLTKKTDYIEGETFQFAPDPELELLAAAEQRLNPTENTAPQKETVPESQNDIASDTPEQPVNFDDIIQGIVLQDIEEGDF